MRQNHSSSAMNGQASTSGFDAPAHTTPRSRASAPEPAPVSLERLAVAAPAVAIGLSAVLVMVGAGALGPVRSMELVAAGCVGILLTIALAPAGILLSRASASQSRDARRAIQDLTAAVQQLIDHAALSDDARRVLNRDAERELLFRAIEEDISAEEWDAAIVLCNELAGRFGFREEAERFRERIDRARAEAQERRIAGAFAAVDQLIVQRRWNDAMREADKALRLFPESHSVMGLHRRIDQARAQYKRDLERAFLQAAEQEQADDALELLKELDQYLTENEAAPYMEVARGVIGRARENLGAQFKLALQDRQWAAAAAIGTRIVQEFPNTRMAQEVRGMLDGLLARAESAA